MADLKQEHYPDLEILNRETDIIEVWQTGKNEANVIQIEREKVNEFINLLIQLKY